MASTRRPQPSPIIEQLEKKPFAFDFFRAVRLVESQHPEHPRVGASRSPAEDPVRFGQNPSLAFAPSTIEGVHWNAEHTVPRLFIHCFGLFGPNGPLPAHLTEYARERQLNYADGTLAAFANIFHHRLICFFYRAWALNQKCLDLDRPVGQRFVDYVGSLFGIGMSSLRNRDTVPDAAKLYYAGHLACPTRHPQGLEAILQDFFGITTQIQTFVGRWMDLPPDSLCRLGESPATGALGVSVIVGSRLWECQLSFRVRLGPMGFEDYKRMLPGGPGLQRLTDWILNYCDDPLFWDVQLVLRATEVPEVRLGQAGRLGWTAWLKTKPFERDADDCIFGPTNA